MANEREPPGGLEAAEAFFEFSDPNRHEAWDRATLAVRRDPRFERSRGGTLERFLATAEGKRSPAPLGKRQRRRDYTAAELQSYLIAKRRARHVLKAVCRDFGERLRSGEIVAFGTPAQAAHRERRCLDADLWITLRAPTRRAWNASRFSGGGHVYHDVRFHRAVDLETWRRGAPLEFAIKTIERLEWENYKAFWSPEHAPEHLSKEDRQVWGEDDRQEFWRTLLDRLAEAGCELRALFPPGDPRAQWVQVSPEVIEVLHTAQDIDFEKSIVVSQFSRRMIVRVFVAGAETPVPDAAVATTTPTSDRVPKGKRGRKPKWDWQGASREIIQAANSPDGLPTPQAEVERLVRDWFLGKFDDCPSESGIRDFVVKSLPRNYRSE